MTRSVSFAKLVVQGTKIEKSAFDFGCIKEYCIIVRSSDDILLKTEFIPCPPSLFCCVFQPSFISHKMFSPTRSHSMPVLAEK